MIKLTINGQVRDTDAEPETPLLWVIREWFGMTGTKYGCGIAQCGACTVHINGIAARSCSIPVGSLGDATISTIENLSSDGLSHPVQVAWLQHDVPQCGYCQSGQIMAAAALLHSNPKPTDADMGPAWLALQCQMIEGATRGLLLLQSRKILHNAGEDLHGGVAGPQ